MQRATDDSGQEATPKELWELFRSTYLAPGEEGPLTLDSWSATEPASGEHRVVCGLGGGNAADGRRRYEGSGNGPLAAFTDALAAAGHPVGILGYAEHALAPGPDSAAVAYVQCRIGGATYWGAGQDTSVLMASVRAVLSAVNRAKGEVP